MQDVATVLAKEYPKGINLAYEGVGGSLRDAVVDNLAPHGRLLAVGYISSYPHTQDVGRTGDDHVAYANAMHAIQKAQAVTSGP